MRLFVQDFIDNTYLAFSIVGISSAAIGIGAVFLPGIGQLVALAWALGDFMLSVGEITLQVTFDNDLYDQLECIFYCNLDDDGRLDQARLDAVGVDIQDIIDDGNVNIVMAAMFNLYGFVGFSNAGVTYADDEANCDDCSCGWCYDHTAANDLGSWTGFFYPNNWTGTAWTATNNVPAHARGMAILLTFTAVDITDAIIHWTGTSGPASNAIVWLFLGGVEQIRVDSGGWASGTLAFGYSGVPVTCDEIRVSVATSTDESFTGDCSVFSIVTKGLETNPFGDDNC